MSTKLMILFSALAVLTTIANSLFLYHIRIEDLNKSAYDNLQALGSKMCDETERYVQQMDYALSELTANVEFVNGLHTAYLQEDVEDVGEFVAVQTLMSRTLYQLPILENFYRVYVYSRNGFFLSNHFEKLDAVVSLSDEAREIVATLPYLEKVDQNPFRRHLLGPHQDPWTSTTGREVFTLVKPVVWHGEFIGYLEVSSLMDELTNIFYVEQMDGLMAQAVFDDGQAFFRHPNDDVVYANVAPGETITYLLPDGSRRLVYALCSKTLGMTIYVSQDMAVYAERVNELLILSIGFSLLVLLITLGITALSAIVLTKSIRRLSGKMRDLPIDNLMADPDAHLSTMVVPRFDKDLYHLEEVFNELITRLQVSHRIEVSLRQGTLQARLTALQTQINPHFVYNTLNIISAKGMESGSLEIIDICAQFAEMLRYSTDLSSQTATLGDELRIARCYLQLLKARYEDRLVFSIDLPAELDTGVLIPKLTLQPIIENAVSHGMGGNGSVLEVRITGAVKNGRLRLSIHDNGKGFDPVVLQDLCASFKAIESEANPRPVEGGGHIGLGNTYLRLFYYSKGGIRMTLQNQGGALVELTLPLQQEE